MDEDAFKAMAGICATLLCSVPDAAMAPAAGCRHALKVGISDNQSVCAVCRTIIDGPAPWGVCVLEPPRKPLLTPPTGSG